MRWSLRIARIAGIDVFVHWTFLLIFVWIGFVYSSQGADLYTTLMAMAFVTTVFGCVVLHELGHALAAKSFGVRTRDITLWPIGGVARLERIPEDPKQELWIAVAGPLVNVAIAAILYAIIHTAGLGSPELDEPLSGSFLSNLMSVNLFLALFNLIPAFPMDGGRVLRALLAHWLSYTRATSIAASIGQVLAIAFAIFGLLNSQPFILFIALFVYLGAEAEARSTQMRSVLAGVPVRDAMISHFRTLAPQNTFEDAANELLAGTQQDFPVLENEQLVGMLWRRNIFSGLQQGRATGQIREAITNECNQADPQEPLDRVLDKMRESGCTAVPVMHHGRLVGLVTNENVLELIAIRAALFGKQKIEPATLRG